VRPERLEAPERYRVVVVLLRDTGFGFGEIGSLAEPEGRRYWEFANATSPDAPLNVLAALDRLDLAYAAGTTTLRIQFTAARYDDFDDPPSTAEVPFRLRVQVWDETISDFVVLANPAFEITRSLTSHAGLWTPVVLAVDETLTLAPAEGNFQYGHDYSATVFLEHLEPDATVVGHGQLPTALQALVPLTGKLFFGDLETRFTDLANDPRVGQIENPEFPGDGFLTVLAVANQSGTLPGQPGLTYGDGTPLPVHIFGSGEARYVGVPGVTLEGSRNGRRRVGTVRFGFARLQLRRDGLFALDAYAGLPAGSGFATDGETRLLLGRMPLGVVPLTPEVQPRGTEFSLNAGDFGLAALWFHHEQLPLRLATDRIVWDVPGNAFRIADGRWSFVREPELSFLEGPALAVPLGPALTTRPGNDHYLRFARGMANQPLRLVVDPQGRGRLDASVALAGGDFVTHFPVDVMVPVQEGQFVLRDGRVNRELSEIRLVPNQPMALGYFQGCPDPGCAGGASAVLEFGSATGTMGLTPDGGLRAVGAVASPPADPARLAWGALSAGRFAQSVGDFSETTFHASGFVLRAEESAVGYEAGDRPGVLLHTGFGQSQGEAILERPFTDGYARGLADYPGLNFRLAGDGAATAVSHLAGQRVPAAGTYPVQANSKYYVRPGGVSGRHQAVAGQFPRDLLLYGFQTSLDGLRLSYLDNQVERSATEGGIAVPFPSDFVQEFAELRLRCNGQLLDAKIRGESRHRLAYWLAPFRSLTMEFRGASNAPCDTTEGVLLLGASVDLPLLQKPALGVLGFRSTGRLVAAADQIPGVDSRLALPPSLEIAGPEGRDYRFTPVTKAYFNAWPGNGGEPADGFANFAGTIDLPWFLDSKVHIHAFGLGAHAILQLMGGWNGNGRPDDRSRAWTDAAGHTFFDRQDFDPTNRGFPADVPVAAYRDPGEGSDRFRPRAQQRLFGLSSAAVDFPIRWESGSRAFRSAGHQVANALVFELQGEAARLSSRQAHLNFAAKVQDRVPHFSASEFLMGEIDDRIGLFSSVSNAIVGVLNDNAVAHRLREGANDLDRLLSPDLSKLIGADLLTALNGPIDELLDEVLAKAQAGVVDAGDFHDALCQHLATGGTALNRFQQQFLETSELVETVGRKVVNSLRTADDGVTSAITIVEPKDLGQGKFSRRVVTEIVQRAIREAPPDAPPLVKALATNVAPSLLDDLIEEYVGEAVEPSLAQIESTLREVHAQLAKAIQELEAGRGGIRDGLEQARSALIAGGSFYRDVTNAVCVDLKSVTLPVTQAASDRVRWREQIKRVVLARLLEGVFPKETHFVLKQFLLPDRGLFRGALEDLFARVNDTIVGVALGPARDLVREPLAGLDEGVLQAAEKLRNLLEGTRIYGYADIAEDELQKLRVEGEFRFHLGPSEMGGDSRLNFDAFYQVERFQGNAPGRGCRPAGETYLETTFGASASPPGGFAQGLKLGVTGRYSLDGAGRLQGLAGGITATGAKKIAGFTAKDPQFGFSVGEEGTYLGGTVAGRFKDFALQARMFVGVACDLGKLDLIDENTARLLADNGVTAADRLAGYYVAGDLTVPLEKFLPIPLPSTCLLRLEGRGGTGSFGFLQPGLPPLFLVGMRQRLGLKGELLCILSGEGDLDLVGAVGIDKVGTPQATIAGTLKIGGSIGICPVCEEITKTFPWVVHLRADDVDFESPF
jgi:hypothetical protein